MQESFFKLGRSYLVALNKNHNIHKFKLVKGHRMKMITIFSKCYFFANTITYFMSERLDPWLGAKKIDFGWQRYTRHRLAYTQSLVFCQKELMRRLGLVLCPALDYKYTVHLLLSLVYESSLICSAIWFSFLLINQVDKIMYITRTNLGYY